MSNEIFAHPAGVLTNRATPAELLEKARGAALDPAVLDNAFFWPAEITSNRQDTYFTHMLPSSLKNYAIDAQAGVAFQDSHDTYKLGYGRSLSGTYEVLSPDLSRVLADFYTVPGIRFGGQHSFQTTDDFIMSVRAGITKDVSIGFYGGRWICDICGENYRSWDCPHIAGVEYPAGEQGQKTILCTVGIDDAHLAEVSAVYDGATPNATILKINEGAADGRIEPETARLLEVRYRIQLPPAKKQFAGVELKERGRPTDTAANGEVNMDYEKLVADMRGVMEKAVPETVTDDVERVHHLVDEVGRLRPLADEGRAYRADLVTAALAEGVRAYGSDFAEETYRATLEAAPLATVKRFAADWKAIGDKQFPGGRLTTDPTPEPAQPEARPSLVPDAAYAA